MVREEVLTKSRELVNQIYEKMSVIESCDSVAEKIKGLDVCFNDVDNKQIVALDGILSAEQFTSVREGIISKIYENAFEAQIFLERLNRKPATINPEFEAAVQDMVKSKDKPIIIKPTMDEQELPPLTKTPQTLQGKKILDKGAEQSDTVFSVAAAPAKPEMNVTDVRRMYQDENKSMAQIAEFFGVTKSMVNNFIYQNKLARNKVKDDGFLDSAVQARQSKGK